MTEPKLSRSAQKRADILNAAKEAFKEQGVNATSMDQLAARAQVSKRTVYNHFASKEALVIHLVADLWKQATQNIEANYSAKEPLQQQLVTLLKAEIEIISSHDYIDMARVALGHYFYKPDALQQELDEFDKSDSALLRWIKSATAQGRLNITEPKQAMEQLHSLIKGESFWPALFQKIEPLNPDEQQSLAERTAAMFLSHYQTDDN